VADRGFSPGLSLLHAAYATAAVPLLAGSDHAIAGPALGVTAVSCAGHLAAGGLVWRRGSPPPAWRRWWIAAEAVLVPAQFVLSIASDLILLGLALSIALLAALRPACPRLRPAGRKLAVTVHVGLSVGWLGVSLVMLALSVAGLVADDSGARHRTYQIMDLLDVVVVIPLVLVSIVSGLVVSLGGKFGLARHWWVLAKLAISLVIPFCGGALSHIWIEELVEINAVPNGAGGPGVALATLMAAFCTGLWTATALSVYKPWGRTPWASARRPAPRATDLSAAARP
jgi:hypothetical protein